MTKALLSFQVLETNVEMTHSHWRENIEFENVDGGFLVVSLFNVPGKVSLDDI